MAGQTKYKTCRRYNEAGHAHALTFSCYQQRRFLARDRARRWFIGALKLARVKHNFALWAYVVMPEHVHLVIFPRKNSYSISDILTDIKQPVTRRATRYLRDHSPQYLGAIRSHKPGGKVVHRFWQRGGGYDRNLFDPEAVHAEIDYIHANPVRRGLIERPEDWAWSSAGYYRGRADCLLVPDVEDLPSLTGAKKRRS